jgi:hypothetical protein
LTDSLDQAADESMAAPDSAGLSALINPLTFDPASIGLAGDDEEAASAQDNGDDGSSGEQVPQSSPMPSGRMAAQPSSTDAADSSGDAPADDACQPELDDTQSWDSVVLSGLGLDDTSCCGASRRCENLPPSCFTPGSQEEACYQHDRCLVGHDATDLHDPASTLCNGQLADRSTSLPIAAAMRSLQRAGQAVQAVDSLMGLANSAQSPIPGSAQWNAFGARLDGYAAGVFVNQTPYFDSSRSADSTLGSGDLPKLP